MPFSVFSSKLFLFLANRENLQNRFNGIFVMEVFLKMYEKTYLKEPQNDAVWSEWKYFFVRFQMFVFFLEYAEEH